MKCFLKVLYMIDYLIIQMTRYSIFMFVIFFFFINT